MKYPQWSTPQRRDKLVETFTRSRGFCVFGHPMCPIEEHDYEVFIEGIIEEWKAEDRDRRLYEWKLEQRTIHTGEKGRWGRRFDPVTRDVFMANQPEYYLVGLGVDALNFKRVALVRIPSTQIHLFVDVSRAGTFRRLSKNQRRKIVRYGASPPADVMGEIRSLCQEAVEDWWTVKAKA